MLHQTLLNRLSWFKRLGQSNHFSAGLALSLSLILAACGGGGNSVTENNLVEPGSDGVAPSLTSVTIENDFNGADYVTQEGGKKSTVLLKLESDEALMQLHKRFIRFKFKKNGTLLSSLLSHIVGAIKVILNGHTSQARRDTVRSWLNEVILSNGVSTATTGSQY